MRYTFYLRYHHLPLCYFRLAADLDFLDVDNLQLQNPGSFNGLQAYKNSKLCNVLMTYYMANVLTGQHVTVNAVDPGNTCSSTCIAKLNVIINYIGTF